jgi:sulfatase modifying factor 1
MEISTRNSILLLFATFATASCGFPRPERLAPDDAPAVADDAPAVADAASVSEDGNSVDARMEPAPDDAANNAPPPASCVNLPRTCGATANDDCCNSPEVAGGTYYRSYDVAGDSQFGDMSNPATVSTFRLDKYEITVGRFRAFFEAGQGIQANPPKPQAGVHPNISGSGWDANWNANLAPASVDLAADLNCNFLSSTTATWTDLPGGNENRPINCITWYEAMAFCAWDGGYLPTEAEWNYAAAGGDAQRAYPWSTRSLPLAIDTSQASYAQLNTDQEIECLGDGLPTCTIADLVLVGTKPTGDGRWGQSDLAGNVLEWTLDWQSPYQTPCTNCANLVATNNKISRGGAFATTITNSASGLRTAGRTGQFPATRLMFNGARCARPAEH